MNNIFKTNDEIFNNCKTFLKNNKIYSSDFDNLILGFSKDLSDLNLNLKHLVEGNLKVYHLKNEHQLIDFILNDIFQFHSNSNIISTYYFGDNIAYYLGNKTLSKYCLNIENHVSLDFLILNKHKSLNDHNFFYFKKLGDFFENYVYNNLKDIDLHYNREIKSNLEKNALFKKIYNSIKNNTLQENLKLNTYMSRSDFYNLIKKNQDFLMLTSDLDINSELKKIEKTLITLKNKI